MVSSIRAADQEYTLAPDEEKLIRDAVYGGKLLIAESDRIGHTMIGVPQPVTEMYVKHRHSVLNLLITIAEGGNPRDSVLAAAYSIALLDGPAVAVVCARNFDRAAYDVVDEDWETTPRKHWITKIRERIAKTNREAAP
jgi:hypothetical protein